MYVVFSTGGKQYRATTGDVITVEKLDAEKGATVELDQVLMVGEGKDVQVGTPYIEGGKVQAKVVEHGRGDKINVIKFKRRKNYLKRQGHRQYFTAIEITGVETSDGKPEKKEAKPADKKVEDQPAAKKATAKKAASKKTSAKKASAKKAAGKKKVTKKAAAKKAEAGTSKGDE